MSLFLFDVFGNASIGVYSLVNDQFAIIPPQVPETKRQKVEEWLKIKVVTTTIGKSLVTGALACSNSNGIILPSFVEDNEVKAIKSSADINVTVMNTKKTAYGNIVLANDKGAVVDPRIESRNKAIIVKAANQIFIGADNGLLSSILADQHYFFSAFYFV